MFKFTIAGLGVFLGKSPVTIRNWERKRLIKLPRVGKNRSLTINDVREVVRIAWDHNRITTERKLLVEETLMLLRMVEQENE